MGRYLGPSCRLCRREGMKLFLKGIKCETAKCQVERRQRVKNKRSRGTTESWRNSL